MSEFAGFVCWDSATVLDTIATEAVSPSHSVFVATHAPLDIRRVTVAGGRVAREELVDEGFLLKDFLERPTNNGVLVIPVIGESGSGKSHLVRWVHAQDLETDRRRVIYLPKDSTSLSGVVDRLLIGLTGSPFDEIRRDVGRLGRDVTQETLERRLLDELAESLRVAPANSPHERALVGESGLHSLLHDPYFRQQLLREASLIRRRAAHAIGGRGTAESDVPLQFTAADLPLDVTEIERAAQASRRLYSILAANDVLQQAAMELLNRHLDVAVMEATNLGVGRLQQAFLEIRRALADHAEIVLLVEDFALIQGVQRDLLDAILETGQREGRTVLAPVRTLLAVTTGYFGSLPDTVRTRVEASSPHRYELRVQLASDKGGRSDTEERIVGFLGRYLNAARVGRTELDRFGATDQANVPNACDACPVREDCHRGFGTAETGHGLYPLNRPALARAVRASAPVEHPESFNPRAALARVVRHILVEYAPDIRAGAFPSERFQTDFQPSRAVTVLPNAVAEKAMHVDPATGPRRRVLLQFWGDAPREFINLAPEIHTAFDIPQIDDVELHLIDPDPDLEEAPRPERDAVPARLSRRIQEIEDWSSRGATFPTELAGELRKVIRGAVVARLRWVDPVMRPPGSAILEKALRPGARTVSIDGADEAILRGTTPAIRFDRSPQNAKFFEDLVKINQGVVEGTLISRLQLDRLAELHAPTAHRTVLQFMGRTDEHLILALRASLIGAALCGQTVPGDPPDVLAHAALWNAQNAQRADHALRSPLWTRLLERHLSARPALTATLREAVGVSQGAGEIHAVDAARLLPLVRVAATRWSIDGARESLPEWSRQAAVFPALELAIEEQLTVLRAVLTDIRSRLPRGTGYADTVDAVNRAVEAGDRHGFVRTTDLPGLKRRNAESTEVTSRDLERLETDLDKLLPESSPEQHLAVAARDRGAGIIVMKNFLVENDTWLDAGLQQTAPDEAAASSLLDRLRDVVCTWRGLIERHDA